MENQNDVMNAYGNLLQISKTSAAYLAKQAYESCQIISEELHLQHNGYVNEVFLAEFVREFNVLSEKNCTESNTLL